ncbi:hypothetical protein GSI_10536 [Ganoderma sinense ZZ0214-1]|uniref:endo-polygalacturonase n=1 Tax=Ganoderma sinense ZZ0214-1 TaxID=1077348 RepID=A0A2G8S1F3_9APHY|nr:hypothetical protein GSI_10536 [Ganoderma sinense ZZ0214-1]
MSAFLRLAALLAFVPFIVAAPSATACTGTISSLDDVSTAVKCTTLNINKFTVPAGKTFELDLASGTTVNLLGDVTFAVKNWAGPLFQIRTDKLIASSGKDITFNGNGHSFDGNGPSYWDGQGGNGGVTKPHPMMKYNVKVLNSPAHTYSVSNPAKLVMSKLIIDNSTGDVANSKSDGKAVGYNIDGFDVSTTDLTIEDSTIHNQDDCIAINKGGDIVFQRNSCTGGHGISIGSVSSDATVSGITIKDNTITNKSTGATVSNITYSGNTGTGLRKFGVLIDQSYPSTLGTPGTGVKLSGVNFAGSTNSISVASGAKRVAVNCGACSGTWEWSALKVSGGSEGKINYSDHFAKYNCD